MTALRSNWYFAAGRKPYHNNYVTREDNETTRSLALGELAMLPNPGGNVMEGMNGYVFGNLPGLTMKVGERVRWYLMATTGFEIHAPHWHGNDVLIHGMRTDVASLLPMAMEVADMIPDDPGIWLFHCHVGPHILAGMQSLYRVEQK